MPLPALPIPGCSEAPERETPARDYVVRKTLRPRSRRPSFRANAPPGSGARSRAAASLQDFGGSELGDPLGRVAEQRSQHLVGVGARQAARRGEPRTASPTSSTGCRRGCGGRPRDARAARDSRARRGGDPPPRSRLLIDGNAATPAFCSASVISQRSRSRVHAVIDLVERGLVLLPLRGRREPRVVGEAGLAHHLAERAPLLLAADRDRYPLVVVALRLVRLVRRHHAIVVAARARARGDSCPTREAPRPCGPVSPPTATDRCTDLRR